MSALRSLIEPHQIAAKIKEVADQIQADYAGKDLVLIMVLKGAICLVADLMRSLTLPLDLETVQASSYGSRGAQRGELHISGLDRLSVQNRDVLLIDDIFDSGYTLTTLLKHIQEKHPSSLKTCVLLNKTGVPKATAYRPDYVLFDIEDLFVVGYGLDFKERYRGLPGIYVLENP
jgi:hypoxanthine phosphoribosyltransferase